MTWQTLNYAWDSRVLGFDAEAQQALTNEIGLPDLRPVSLLLLERHHCCWICRHSCDLDANARHALTPIPFRAFYARFCAKAARLGAPRDPTEGPVDFARRAGQFLPQESGTHRNHFRLLRWIALRAGRWIPPCCIDSLTEVRLFCSTRN